MSLQSTISSLSISLSISTIRTSSLSTSSSSVSPSISFSSLSSSISLSPSVSFSSIPSSSSSHSSSNNTRSSDPDTTPIPPTSNPTTHTTRDTPEYTPYPTTTTSYTPTKSSIAARTLTSSRTSASSASGVLSTSPMNPNSNPFAHHAGAVVGVVFGVIFAVVFSAIWILIARRKRNEMQQIASDPGLASTRERSWRTPLEDGEDGGDAYHRPMAEQYPGILSALESSDNHPESGGSDADGLTSGALRRGSSLGQRPHMTGFGQAAETIAMAIPVGSLYPANKRTLSLPSINFVTHSSREHEPDFVQGSNWTSPPTHLSTSGHSSGHGQEDAYGGGSTVSLNTYAPLASSHGHGATSSSSATSMNSPRSSGSKPLLSTPSSHGQRASGSKVHSLTSPPTSFAFKGSDDSDTRSLKGFIGLLRRDRSPASKIEPPPRRRHSLESRMPFSSSPYTSSPSSLLGPRPAGGIDTVLRKPSLSMGLYGGQPSSSPWPGSGPLTLPSQPSAMTLGLPVSEGLLNPRLESLASLEDHEDYSRPIGGVVNNKAHSTTTFNTQDTATTRDPDGEPGS